MAHYILLYGPQVGNHCSIDLDTRAKSQKSHITNQVSDERKQPVIDYIDSFPKATSHYSRAKNQHRKYVFNFWF